MINVRRFVLLLLGICFGIPLYAQREQNMIYLFDCTNSMQKSGIWEPANTALKDAIQTQMENQATQFIIIPFGNSPYRASTFSGEEARKLDWDKLRKEFDKDISIATSTHISDVLRAGFSMADPNKDNSIFLLTDGSPNAGDTPEKVAATIREWCGNHTNSRLFYVALEGATVSPVIQSAIDQCDDAHLIYQLGKSITIPTPIVGNEVYASLLDLGHSSPLGYSDPGNVPMHAEGSDPYFNVTVKDNTSTKGRVSFIFSTRNGIRPEELYDTLRTMSADGFYNFSFTVVSDHPSQTIANPEITAHILLDRHARLDLLDGTTDELAVKPGAKWHGSFLWSQASGPGCVTIDLAPRFTDVDAGKGQPSAAFAVNATDGSDKRKPLKDYVIEYDGHTMHPGEVFVVRPGDQGELKIIFDTDARQGKRYFTITPVAAENLGIINSVPVSELNGLSIRTSYDEEMNPLLVALLWIVGLLAIAALLWFCIGKMYFFPTMKTGPVTMTGPGDYYSNIKVKGLRKVVYTSGKRKQGLLSRMFTGKVRYVTAPHFTPEITVTPGTRKKIRFHGAGVWLPFPGNSFTSHSEGELTNQQTKDNIKITIN